MDQARAFPDGFLWGSAGSAHQTEGNNSDSDWWRHERARRTTAHERSGRACDSYRRFAEDWSLVAGSGQNAVRLSIEWARIEPRPGAFSTRELDHYREVIGAARDAGLRTMVTFHHFTNPQWFAERGGWDSPEAVEMFARYARTAAAALGDLLELANTINEPSVVAIVGHLMGYFPPRVRDLGTAHRVSVNLLRAHVAAAREIRAACGAKVGLPLSLLDVAPADDSPEARRSMAYMHHWWNGVWLEALRTGRVTGLDVPDATVEGLAGSDDFIGIQYYTRQVVGRGAEGGARGSIDERRIPDPAGPDERFEARRTQMGWEWHPRGLGRVVEQVAEIGLPIYVTENGIATDDDAERIEFVRLHVAQLHDEISRGVDLRGYFYWSYIDNFEWNEGYRPRFGLIACDRKTFERTPKPSLAWYGGVAKANRLD